MNTAFERRVRRLRERVQRGSQKSLDDLTIKELREVAEEKGLEGYWSMKRAELVEALKG